MLTLWNAADIANARDLSIAPFRHKQKARVQNDWQFLSMFSNLFDLTLDMFEWSGLPDTCNAAALEYSLAVYGRCLFFFNKDPSHPAVYMHTPVSLVGEMNMYYEPTRREATSYNYQWPYGLDDSVLIKNTPLMKPSLTDIYIYTEKLVDAARTIDVYTKGMKRPFVMVGTAETKLALEIIKSQIDGNETEVFIDKNTISPDALTVTPTASGTSSLIDLWTHKKNLLDEYLTLRGINTANTEKRERLITNEVDANNQYTGINAQILLRQRVLACEQINTMFGLNVSVDFSDGYGPIEEEPEEVVNEGGDDNE